MTINPPVSKKSLKNEHWTAAYKKGTREMTNNMNQKQNRWQEQLWPDSHTQNIVSVFPMKPVSAHVTLAKGTDGSPLHLIKGGTL